MKNKEVYSLLVRYGLLVLFGIWWMFVFYFVFTPLTVEPVFWILNLFYDAYAVDTATIFFEGIYLNIIPACVAGSAYYLLLMLNLSTPMKIGTRVKSLLFLFGVFLGLNITRIVCFSVLFYSGYSYFDITHRIFWYLGSTIMVVMIWFGSVWFFSIKRVPVYSDLEKVFRSIRKT